MPDHEVHPQMKRVAIRSALAALVRCARRIPRWPVSACAALAFAGGMAVFTYNASVIGWHYENGGGVIAGPDTDFRIRVAALIEKAAYISSDPKASFVPVNAAGTESWEFVSRGRGSLFRSEIQERIDLPNDAPTNLLGWYMGLMRQPSAVRVEAFRSGEGLAVAFKGIECGRILSRVSPYTVRRISGALSKDMPDPDGLAGLRWSQPGKAEATCHDGKWGYTFLMRFDGVP